MLAKYEDVFFVQETVKVFEIYFHMGYCLKNRKQVPVASCTRLVLSLGMEVNLFSYFEECLVRISNLVEYFRCFLASSLELHLEGSCLVCVSNFRARRRVTIR
jgi:hypothetical protein